MSDVSFTAWIGRSARALMLGVAALVVVPAGAQPVPTERPLDQPLGERVEFDIAFEEGDEFAYRTRMELMVTQQQLEAEPVEQVLSYDVTQKFTVQNVEEDGTATIAVRVTEADIAVGDGEERLEFSVGQLAEGEEYPNPFAAAIGQTVVTLVIDPDGVIRSVLGAEAYQTALEATEGADPRQLGFFSAEQMRDIFQPLFTIEELRGTPRRVGSGWATTREVELPPVAILDLNYNWTLDGYQNDLATMTATVETAVRRPNTPDPARPTIVLEESAGNVVSQWNGELKRVTRRVSTLSMRSRWTLGELVINLDQRSVVRIERVPLEG